MTAGTDPTNELWAYLTRWIDASNLTPEQREAALARRDAWFNEHGGTCPPLADQSTN